MPDASVIPGFRRAFAASVACCATALLLAIPLRAASPIPFTVLADRVWKPATLPALLPHGSVIYPIWCAQNVWKPWRQWAAQPPKFDAYLREAGMVFSTGARPFPAGGQDDIPDLYREGPDGAMLPFDASHPLFRALQTLRDAGIKPLIDLGPVPLALCPSRAKPRIGIFELGVEGPGDSAAYSKYFAFVKALFTYLQGPGYFTKAELETWGYQLLREPDNPEVWDPAGSKKMLDPANLGEYKKLYDWTLAGMRAAGLRLNLAFGNLAVPYPGNIGQSGCWMEPLCRWVVSDSVSACPRLSLPRIDTSRVMKVGFTAYGCCQLGSDPDNLAVAMRQVHAAVSPWFKRGNLIISVGEGNLALSAGNNRSDGTERGAAWNAAIYKNGLDYGLHRFQQWGFSSGGHLSEFEDGRGLMSPSFNVVRMFRMMEGDTRLEASVPDRKEADGARVNGLAARDSNGALRLLVYHYQADFRAGSSKTVTLDVRGLKPAQRYLATHYRVDKTRGNYFRRWMADLGSQRMAGDSLDALVGFQLTPDQRVIWDKHRSEYSRLSDLAKAQDSTFEAKASRTGIWSRRVVLPPNSVSLFVLVPAG